MTCPRTGRPRRISGLARAAIAALACQLPAAAGGVPLARWTGPELPAGVTRAGIAGQEQLPVSPVLRFLAGNPEHWR